MDERRRAPRHRTLKSGTIEFNRAGGISCTVRNLSEIGANLEVAGQIGVPDDFTLTIAADHLTRRCHVIWRGGNRIGVSFEP